jgi:hypothetical protein
MRNTGGGRDQALKMLDTFASVGVGYFDITHTNIDEEKRGFRPKQSLEQTRQSMPYLIDSAPRRQNNVIIRPHHPAAAFLIQLDDLKDEALARVQRIAFMTVSTSPGNHQAWVAVESERLADRKDFARRVRKAAGADLNASGATRVAGTANFKRKYEPDFPVIVIASAQPGLTVRPAALEALGLVAAPEQAANVSSLSVTKRARGKWPSYDYCLRHAPAAHNSDRPDISRVDFTWCMTALDWGWSIEDTAARLMEESSKAKENGTPYSLETARNAAIAVERRRGNRQAASFRR